MCVELPSKSQSFFKGSEFSMGLRSEGLSFRDTGRSLTVSELMNKCYTPYSKMAPILIFFCFIEISPFCLVLKSKIQKNILP